MDKDQYKIFMFELVLIKEALRKIIELLEIRNSIETARNQMRRGTIYFDHSEVFPDNPTKYCNCDAHMPGESTGGWHCPVHGQQF
ncbi:hypothetical protein KAR91_81780 [Candidatus Pacearchaeota archaeon]|nr:hypothetical protein [Candidatus Pacearchaeota archaeon]